MDSIILLAAIGSTVVIAIVAFLVVFLIRRKRKKEFGEELTAQKQGSKKVDSKKQVESSVRPKGESKEEMDKLISKNAIQDLLDEGNEQLSFGNIANAKKVYKRLLHEYDSLDKKDRESYTKISNFYQKIKDSISNKKNKK